MPTWLVFVIVAIAMVGTVAVRREFWYGDDPETSAIVSRESPTASPIRATAVRDTEYAKIARLRGGLSLAYFEDVLGTPWFVTPAKTGDFTQYLFRGHDYWVQAIADRGGSVQLMSVTSCSSDFRPRFEGTAGSPQLGPVVLNETRFAETGTSPSSVRYFIGGTSNTYFYDEYYFGNAGGYETYYVGINDACPSTHPADGTFALSNYTHRPFDATDGSVAKFRTEAVANTYAEGAADIAEFQIGADRILTRTAPPPPDE